MRNIRKTMIQKRFRFVFWASVLALLGTQANRSWSTDIQPYGYIEMDAIYSTRGTNPLDPPWFNAYVTAAASSEKDTSSFSPRFSVIGLKAMDEIGNKKLTGKVEMDFYGSGIGNPEPRLRLAFIDLAVGNSRFTVGQDWVPVASLNPSALDFSIMGYGGNLWQRIPQITYRQKLGKSFEVLATAMRFARGQTISTPNSKVAFQDDVKMPYIGSRFAWMGWGKGDKGSLAISGAFRKFSTTETVSGISQDKTINSGMVALELVLPITGSLTFASEVAYGQALGDEFFRFAQAMDGINAIKTVVGFGELKLGVGSNWSFAGGYGVDDPNNSDITNNLITKNYLVNQRAYFNVVRTIVESFKVGAEYTWVSTEYTVNRKFTGGQAMLSFWYGFWL